MKKPKIIYLYYRSYGEYFPDSASKYYYLAGHSALIAQYFLKYTQKFAIENWRPDKYISKPLTKEIDGIVCRLFPAKHYFHAGAQSSAFLCALKKEFKNNPVIIHHSGVHHLNLYLLRFSLPKAPIVATQFGEISPFTTSPSKKLSKYCTRGLKQIIEKKVLHHIDHFFVASTKEVQHIANSIGVSREKISFPEIGTDFNTFNIFNKELARTKLGLPLGKKIMLYIGKFDDGKGLDTILRIFPKLINQYDAHLVLIGGFPGHRYYDDVFKLKNTHPYSYLSYDVLPLFHNAADVFLRPVFSENRAVSVGANIIESLACNTPVVSTTLKDFPDDERENLGEMPENEEDVLQCISKIFMNPERYSNCREIVKRYYDWEVFIPKMNMIYESLLEQYYNIR